MHLLAQPRTTDPGRSPFNQLDLFRSDLKWLCQFTVWLPEEKKNELSLPSVNGVCWVDQS